MVVRFKKNTLRSGVGGAALVSMFNELIKDKPKLRVLILTWPPWGVYEKEEHDIALTNANKKVGCHSICFHSICVLV